VSRPDVARILVIPTFSAKSRWAAAWRTARSIKRNEGADVYRDPTLANSGGIARLLRNWVFN
jgi:hypothetical protein